MRSVFYLWWKRERHHLGMLYRTLFLIFDKVTLPYVVILIGGMAAALYWDFMLADRSWIIPLYGLFFWGFLFFLIGGSRYALHYVLGDEAFLFLMPLPWRLMGVLSALFQWGRDALSLFLLFLLLSPALHDLFRWELGTTFLMALFFVGFHILLLNLKWMVDQWNLWPRRVGKFVLYGFLMLCAFYVMREIYFSPDSITGWLIHPFSFLLLFFLLFISCFFAWRSQVKDPIGMIEEMMRRRLGFFFYVYGGEWEKVKGKRREALFFTRSRFGLPFTTKWGMAEFVWRTFLRRKELWQNLLKIASLALVIAWKLRYWEIQAVVIVLMLFILSDMFTAIFHRKEDFWFLLLPIGGEGRKGVRMGIASILMLPFLLVSGIAFFQSLPLYVLSLVWLGGYLFTDRLLVWKLRWM